LKTTQSKIDVSKILDDIIADNQKEIKKIQDTCHKLCDIAKKIKISTSSLKWYCQEHGVNVMKCFSPEKKIVNYIDNQNLEKLLKIRGIMK